VRAASAMRRGDRKMNNLKGEEAFKRSMQSIWKLNNLIDLLFIKKTGIYYKKGFKKKTKLY
jgi:cob(I)alamin adenosyltransferase